MLNKNCNIVKDLLPLYAEGMASEESRGFVEEHLACCEDCRKELEDIKKEPTVKCEPTGDSSDLKKALKKLRGRIEVLAAMIIIFGSVLGVGLTNHTSMFYNIVIMPIIGALGYVIMRWRALYNIPIILVLSTVLEMFLRFIGGESVSLAGYFGMLIYYAPAALVGIVIAALYAFAFRKEEKQ